MKKHLQMQHIAKNERAKRLTSDWIFKCAEGRKRKIHMTIQYGVGGTIFMYMNCPTVFVRKLYLDLYMTIRSSGLHVCI